MTRFFTTVALLCIAPTATLAAPIFEFEPDRSDGVYARGETVRLSLLTADAPAAIPTIVGVSFDIAYDPAVIGYVTTEFSPAFDFASDPQSEASATTPGLIRNATAAALFGSISVPNALVATLIFEARSFGESAITLGGTAGVFAVTEVGSIDETLQTDVAVVPLPATVGLFCSALAALLLWRAGSVTRRPSPRAL